MATSMARFTTRNLFKILLNSDGCKAVRSITSSQLYVFRFGDPTAVLRQRHQELSPTLGPREVMVKMLMAPINPSDVNMMEGTYFVQPSLPAVMGNEGIGQIVETGPEVKGLQVGDMVIPADTAWGTWQTYKISHDEDVLKLPNDISVLSAATISVNPCTAYRMLKDYIDLKPGDVIIQNGANSGVGVSVIQLAKEWKFKTINIVRNRPDFDKLKEYLLSLGADAVVTEEFVRTPQMKELLNTFSKKPKLAFNCVGGQSATELIRHLGQKGVMVTYGGMSKRPVMAPTGALLFKEIVLCGYWNTNWNRIHKTDIARYEMLSDLSRLIKESKFKPPLCEFFKLDDYKAAIEKATEGFKGVKAVFDMQ
ncbi:enoyl-[acyl-carrier-protein] reductase, mitochondrial-like [Physella acuta]|uniref:enoyl-[acyl-carrier-protein] reductase, mitochondrial-like n=1 Tax=Physella acuta TaxID=109671 RepID=UPI0027DDE518|nr:enoyl-[acyl-carrier-protein] reductase, mitochondrial-like [Physella acuta]